MGPQGAVLRTRCPRAQCPPPRSHPNAGDLPIVRLRRWGPVLSRHTRPHLSGSRSDSFTECPYLPGTVPGHRDAVASHQRHPEDREEVAGGPSGRSRAETMENWGKRERRRAIRQMSERQGSLPSERCPSPRPPKVGSRKGAKSHGACSGDSDLHEIGPFPSRPRRRALGLPTELTSSRCVRIPIRTDGGAGRSPEAPTSALRLGCF